jgi:ABC-type amino acid transport system permease subunit
VELLGQAKRVVAENFRSVESYMLAGMLYFIMSFVAAYVIRWLERKLRPAYLA